jgi:Tol biopolymer transport system component
MQINTVFTKIIILIVLAASLAGCGISPTPILSVSTPENAGPPASPQAVETPQATETVGPEPAPETPMPQSDGILRAAYIKDGNLWLWTEANGPQALTSSGNVSDVYLSDDGMLAAFTRQVDDFHSEIWVVNTDGAGERLLVSTADIEAMVSNRSQDASGVAPHQIAWIPGTHALAFNTRQSFMVGFLVNDDLRLVNAASGEQVTLLPTGAGGMFYFSPDGSQIAITTPNKLFLVNTDGSNRRDDLLTYEEVLTASEYRFYAEPVWLNDSSALLVAIPPRDPLAARDQATTIWRVPSDGSPAIQLGGVPATFFGGGVAFSPNQTKLIYQREVGLPQDNLRELHVANHDLTEDRVLFTIPMLQFHGWAGDSQHFFFSAGLDNQMQLGSLDGVTRSLMPEPGGFLSIRPVGTDRFLYLKEDQGAWEFGLADLTGEKQVIDQITGFPVSYDLDL